jgi:hypothetical protein
MTLKPVLTVLCIALGRTLVLEKASKAVWELILDEPYTIYLEHVGYCFFFISSTQCLTKICGHSIFFFLTHVISISFVIPLFSFSM